MNVSITCICVLGTFAREFEVRYVRRENPKKNTRDSKCCFSVVDDFVFACNF